MRHKYIYTHIIFLLFCFTSYSYAQNELTVIKEINVQADKIYSDHIGNFYVLHQETLTKYDSLGTKSYTYSNLQYGNISHVDVSNPLKILIFFKDFNSILYLDKTLSPQGGIIDLNHLTSLSSLVCSSYQNGIWLYEPLNSEMIRYNQNFKMSSRSGNIQMQLGEVVQPTEMQEVSNRIYITTTKGFFVFDRYGAFIKTYPFSDAKCLHVINENLFFLKGKNLHSYNTKTLEHTILDISEFDAEFITFDGSYLYLYTKKKINIILINNY